MRLPATTTAIACALSLLVPAVARADHGELVADPTVSSYMRIAADYWGQEPHCTGPNGEWIAAHAVYGDNPDQFVGAWAELPGCRLWLNRRQWPAAPNEAHCNLIAHEWGHMLGQDHSLDPGSLMWGGGTNLVVPGCVAFREPEVDDAEPAETAPPVKKRLLRKKTRRKARKKCTQARLRRHGVSKRAKRQRLKRCVRKPARHRRARKPARRSHRRS